QYVPRSAVVMRLLRVSVRNSRFQQWAALLTNRTKRTRSGEFIVQGVRPMTLALDHGWGVAAVLHAPEPTLTEPALALVRRAIDAEKSTGDRVERVERAPELLAELGGKEE